MSIIQATPDLVVQGHVGELVHHALSVKDLQWPQLQDGQGNDGQAAGQQGAQQRSSAHQFRFR